jgi:sortase B
MKGKVRTALIVLLLAVFLFSAYQIWDQTRDYRTGRSAYQAMAQYAVLPEQPDPDDGLPWPEVDFDALREVNPDIVGWLYVPGTVINYPVYQGRDNEWYLRHSATGEWTIGGQIFLDCENTKPGMVDQQSILYGHHLKDGSMFYPLFLLKDQETFDATKTIWYVTEEHEYELEPLMAYFTHPEDQEVRRFQFTSDDEFHNYLKERLSHAVSKRADADQVIANAKHVLTMSTCNYYEGYGRSELIAIPKNEANGTAATQQQGTPAEAAAAAADVVADASSQEAQ